MPVQKVVPVKVEFTDFDPRRPAPVSDDVSILHTQQSIGGSAVPNQLADEITTHTHAGDNPLRGVS